MYTQIDLNTFLINVNLGYKKTSLLYSLDNAWDYLTV